MRPRYILISTIIIITMEIIAFYSISLLFSPQNRWKNWKAENYGDSPNYWIQEGSKYTVGAEIAIDGEDNIYLMGFGSSHLYNYLNKYNDKGKLLWTAEINETNTVQIYCISLDSRGDIYLGGRVHNLSDTSLVLMKYNNSGQKLWSKMYKGDILSDMKIDSSNNLYLLAIKSCENSTNNFILKVDEMGILIWNKTIWENNKDIYYPYVSNCNSLVINQENEIYVGGHYKDDVILFKCNSSGVPIMNISVSEIVNPLEDSISIELDKNDDIILFYLHSLFKINSSLLTSWSVKSSFFLWTKSDIAVNKDNSILLTASHISRCYRYELLRVYLPGCGGFDDPCGCYSIGLERYTKDGILNSSITCTGCFDVRSTSIALDSYGNVYISGILRLEGGPNPSQELVLFKNPKNNPPNCVEIYWDVLLQLSVVFTIIGAFIFYIINKRRM